MTVFLFNLVLSFLGGLSLNFLPCIFPLIPMRLNNLLLAANDNDHKPAHAIGYSILGNIVCFILILTSLKVLTLLGHFVFWGGYMTTTYAKVFGGVVLILIGLDTLGSGERFMSTWTFLQQIKPPKLNLLSLPPLYYKSFMEGFMVVFLASPCCGPGMAAFVGVLLSATVPAAVFYIVAASIGIGAPGLLISMFPRILDYLPKTGKWNSYFKYLMGLLTIGLGLAYLTGY